LLAMNGWATRPPKRSRSVWMPGWGATRVASGMTYKPGSINDRPVRTPLKGRFNRPASWPARWLRTWGSWADPGPSVSSMTTPVLAGDWTLLAILASFVGPLALPAQRGGSEGGVMRWARTLRNRCLVGL